MKKYCVFICSISFFVLAATALLFVPVSAICLSANQHTKIMSAANIQTDTKPLSVPGSLPELSGFQTNDSALNRGAVNGVQSSRGQVLGAGSFVESPAPVTDPPAGSIYVVFYNGVAALGYIQMSFTNGVSKLSDVEEDIPYDMESGMPYAPDYNYLRPTGYDQQPPIWYWDYPTGPINFDTPITYSMLSNGRLNIRLQFTVNTYTVTVYYKTTGTEGAPIYVQYGGKANIPPPPKGLGTFDYVTYSITPGGGNLNFVTEDLTVQVGVQSYLYYIIIVIVVLIVAAAAAVVYVKSRAKHENKQNDVEYDAIFAKMKEQDIHIDELQRERAERERQAAEKKKQEEEAKKKNADADDDGFLKI